MSSNINNYSALNSEHKWEDLVVSLSVHWSGGLYGFSCKASFVIGH